MKSFCDILSYTVIIVNWFIETSFFEGPPTCQPLNEFGDAACPDESFNDIVNFYNHFNQTLNTWNKFPGTEQMFACFENIKPGREYDFYSQKIIKNNAKTKKNYRQ